MAYDVMDISRYVINYSLDKNKPVSNLKLQKLLYYIQAAFLVNKEEPCFKDPISRWKHGPVQEDVYRAFRHYKDNKILERQEHYNEMIVNSDLNFEWALTKFDDNKISDNDKELINKVIDSYGEYGAWKMVQKTHNESPWLETDSNDEIQIKKIKDYFNNKEIEIYGE